MIGQVGGGHARVRETMSEGGTSGRKGTRGQAQKDRCEGRAKCTGAEKSAHCIDVIYGVCPGR